LNQADTIRIRYFDIDRAILWKTATEDIPELLAELRPLVAQD